MDVLQHRATAMPVVIITAGVCRTLTTAAQYALRGYSPSARRKLVKWLGRWMREQQADPQLLIERSVGTARTELEEFLGTHGCRFSPMKGSAHRDGIIRVKRRGKDTTEISILLNALLHFYEWLIDHGHRTEPNPLMIDGYKKKDIADRRRLDSRRERGRRFFVFNGLRYETHSDIAYKPKMQDPSRIRDEIMTAGKEVAWPEEITLAMQVMADSGCRIGELPELNAWDWWEASKFGDEISAPNKSSDGMRVKFLLLQDETANRLAQAFEKRIDGYASTKNMHMLKKWANRWDAEERLSRILLFPRPEGTPYSEWSLRETFFNKAAMHAQAIVPQMDGSEKKPTPHVFRHARIDEEIRKLDVLYPDFDDFAAALIDFAEMMHFNPENILRYAAATLHKRRMRIRREILKTNIENVTAIVEENVDETTARSIVERMKRCPR